MAFQKAQPKLPQVTVRKTRVHITAVTWAILFTNVYANQQNPLYHTKYLLHKTGQGTSLTSAKHVLRLDGVIKSRRLFFYPIAHQEHLIPYTDVLKGYNSLAFQFPGPGCSHLVRGVPASLVTKTRMEQASYLMQNILSFFFC